MAFQTIYRLQTTNDEGQLLIVHISDTESGEGAPTYHDLKLVDIKLKIENPDQDKFKIVFSKAINFSFIPTTTYGLSTFLSGNDNKFLVEVFLSNTSILIYTGYLLTDQTQEAMLDKSDDGSWSLFVVELTASDNIPVLKDLPMTNDSDENPRGFFKPIEYISWILKKTGLELPINIVDGMSYAVDPATEGNWYNTIRLWSKTFEEDINVSVNCYEALEIMLAGRRLFQEQGFWWILSVDEMIGGAYTIWEYDSDGVFLGLDSNTYEKTVGRNQPLKLAFGDAVAYPERMHKFDRLETRYEMPREIPDNLDFDRGAQTSYDIPTKTGLYDIDDWTLEKIGGGTPTVTAKIKRVFEDVNQTYTNEKYVVISAGAFHHIRSNAIYVHEKDKVTLSVDRKMASDQSVTGPQTELMGQLRLVGYDGTYWTCNGIQGAGGIGEWVATNSSFSTNQRHFAIQYNGTGNNESEWQTANIDSKPIPTDGELFVCISNSSLFGASADTHISNLNFEYIPFINGDYSKYTGQHHEVSQSGNLKNSLIEQVFMSDMPKKMLKGAMLFLLSGDPMITTLSFRNHTTGLGIVGFDRYGKYQAYAYFHQYFRTVIKIEGSVTGLASDTNPSNLPGLLHQYTFDFAQEFTDDQIFCLVNYVVDLDKCTWEATFMNVVNTTLGHTYSGDHEFKYQTI